MTTNGGPAIVCEGVQEMVRRLQALKGISVSIAEREVVVVIGPSGSGKSTLIRCINRLEVHQEGRIVVDGIELTNDLRNIDAIRREVGMVFQQFNLFPHLTVLENITLAPIWVRKQTRTESEEAGNGAPRAGRHPRAGREIPRPALRRAATAGGDRSIVGDEPQDHAL